MLWNCQSIHDLAQKPGLKRDHQRRFRCYLYLFNIIISKKDWCMDVRVPIKNTPRAITQCSRFKDEPLRRTEEMDAKMSKTAALLIIQRTCQIAAGSASSLLIFLMLPVFLGLNKLFFLLSYRVFYLWLDKWQTPSDRCTNTVERPFVKMTISLKAQCFLRGRGRGRDRSRRPCLLHLPRCVFPNCSSCRILKCFSYFVGGGCQKLLRCLLLGTV